MGMVVGSLACAGKVKRKTPRGNGRAHKRMQYNRHFSITGGGRRTVVVEW
ncbi:hypothetical protein C5167_015207 [Papaver somniferum]|uniref:40S ribosomal protein S30 n=1 Tax=Papaver somniferum TaxID=3469 RepID=A0A4Y7J998_PAPSO|nr:hypothetical protein C5167_015207 [Papaver somniferum]